MIRFLKGDPRFYTLYVLIAFFLFAVIWFSTRGPASEGSSSLSSLSVPTGIEASFTPNASNVTRSATEQLDALRMRVAKAPEDTTHIFRLARLLHDGHQVEEAARYYKHYLALRPQNRQAWLDAAQCLAQTKRWEEAEETIASMLVHYPDDPTGLYNLGAIYANQSRVEEARRVWQPLARQVLDATIAEMAQTSLYRLDSFVKPHWVEAE